MGQPGRSAPRGDSPIAVACAVIVGEFITSALDAPAGSIAGTGRVAVDRGAPLDAPQRPPQSPQRHDLLLFVITQDVAHDSVGTAAPRRRQRLGRYVWWPVFRCPSMAGFGCPPRRRNNRASREGNGPCGRVATGTGLGDVYCAVALSGSATIQMLIIDFPIDPDTHLRMTVVGGWNGAPYFTGTRRFSTSNQFCTTTISRMSVGAVLRLMTKRPSGRTS